MHLRRTFCSAVTQCGILAVILLGYHWILRWLMTEHGLRLGAISHRLAPFYGYWRPHWKGWVLIPLILLGFYFAFLRRTRLATSMRDRMASCVFFIAMIAMSVGVGMIDGGPSALVAPLLRTDLEYYGAIDRVEGVRAFMREFPERSGTMPMHAQVHPPGAVLFLWANSQLLGRGPGSAAAGIIGFSALSVLILFQWSGRLDGAGTARRAAALCVVTPSLVLFSATSMDGPFAVFLIATMWMYWEANLAAIADPDTTSPHGLVLRSQERLPSTVPVLVQNLARRVGPGARPPALGAMAGLIGAVSSLMTYSVTVVLLHCGLATLVWWVSVPSRRGMILAVAASAVTSFVAVPFALWLCTGFDAVDMFLAAVRNSNHIMSGTRHESLDRYLHLIAGNLVVFFTYTGLPCAVLWWRELSRVIRGYRRAEATTDPTNRVTMRNFMITAALTLLISASVPVYVLEVERVWMFLVPLVLIPVASRLFELERGSGQVGATFGVCLLLAIQTVLTEIFVSTYW